MSIIIFLLIKENRCGICKSVGSDRVSCSRCDVIFTGELPADADADAAGAIIKIPLGHTLLICYK